MAVSNVIGLCSPLSRTHPHEASGRVERGEAGGRSGNTLSPCPGPWGAPIPGFLQNRAGLSPVSAQASLSSRQICSVAAARWHLPPVPTRGRQGMRQCPRAIAALKPDAGKALASTRPLWGLRPAAPPGPGDGAVLFCFWSLAGGPSARPHSGDPASGRFPCCCNKPSRT